MAQRRVYLAQWRRKPASTSSCTSVKEREKTGRKLPNPAALLGRTTALRLTRSKCRRAARAWPDNETPLFPQNPGCFAEVTPAVSRLAHVDYFRIGHHPPGAICRHIRGQAGICPSAGRVFGG
jgi:hypothetical protein